MVKSGHLSKLLLLATVSLGYSTTHENRWDSELDGDEAAIARHSDYGAPEELNVNAMDTYESSFMALMQSPCRPETDGYFGSTTGSPTEIQFGFNFEAHPLTPIMEVLEVIEDRIVDSVLSNSFPQICGFHRRQLGKRDRASGFRFMKFMEMETCNPKKDRVNYCGVFTGQVNVYGKHQGSFATEVLSMIEQVIDAEDPSLIDERITDLSPASDWTFIKKGDNYDEQAAVHPLGWAGVALVAIIFLAGVWWFFIRNEKEEDTGYPIKAKRNPRNKRPFFNRIFRRHQRRMDPYDTPETRSIQRSVDPEGASFDGATMLLNDSGRPRVIDYDPTYTSEVSSQHLSHETLTLDSHPQSPSRQIT